MKVSIQTNNFYSGEKYENSKYSIYSILFSISITNSILHFFLQEFLILHFLFLIAACCAMYVVTVQHSF